MDKERKLAKLLAAMDEQSMTQEEFFKAFDTVISIFKDMKTALEKRMDDIAVEHKTALSHTVSRINTGATEEMETLRKKVMDFCTSKMDKMYAEHASSMNLMRDKLREIHDGKDADEDKIVDSVLTKIKLPEQKEVILDTGEDILKKVQALEEGERWDIKDVNGLEKELDKLRKMKTQGWQGWFGGGGGLAVKNSVMVYDLSAKLDGVTKTFALPAFWRVLTVDLSSFPNTLRPTIDYTTDASAMTITFTDEIAADSSLAAGQTVIITYVSA